MRIFITELFIIAWYFQDNHVSWQMDSPVYLCDQTFGQISWIISPSFVVLPNKNITVSIEYILAPNATFERNNDASGLQIIVIPSSQVSDMQFCQVLVILSMNSFVLYNYKNSINPVLTCNKKAYKTFNGFINKNGKV